MAAVEPVCFYPNRKYVQEFNHRKLNMKKLSEYLYQEKINESKEKEEEKEKEQNNNINTNINTNNSKEEEEEEEDILFKLKQPYYLPEYYNSTFVNEMPLIDILPARRIHETTKQYKQYETLHYEEPAWTKAEKELFNLLYNTIGKNFHKMAKEFENKATTIVIPSTILKQTKASPPPPPQRRRGQKNEKRKMEGDHSISCHALPSQDNKTIHLLVHDVTAQQDIQKEEMIFPRTTSEIIHFYYKNKFNIPNWKVHKDIKINLRKNKKSTTKK
ncbi:hypothetical protein PIROE2DRAFT_61647 [Piromyces sp. E2]|nr:hypothetical protein PIROE2DRAFT_61647 [Piromyces sp. E2]|eukprot:OUM62819.1 hypothetical protein PIROE2DRAFT_61647 [Piromyces sp. E2]